MAISNLLLDMFWARVALHQAFVSMKMSNATGKYVWLSIGSRDAKNTAHGRQDTQGFLTHMLWIFHRVSVCMSALASQVQVS